MSGRVLTVSTQQSDLKHKIRALASWSNVHVAPDRVSGLSQGRDSVDIWMAGGSCE